MTQETARQQLAAIILGKSLSEYVNDKRIEGLAWRKIAKTLSTDTNGRVNVTHETLRIWYGDDAKAPAA